MPGPPAKHPSVRARVNVRSDAGDAAGDRGRPEVPAPGAARPSRRLAPVDRRMVGRAVGQPGRPRGETLTRASLVCSRGAGVGGGATKRRGVPGRPAPQSRPATGLAAGADGAAGAGGLTPLAAPGRPRSPRSSVPCNPFPPAPGDGSRGRCGTSGLSSSGTRNSCQAAGNGRAAVRSGPEEGRARDDLAWATTASRVPPDRRLTAYLGYCARGHPGGE